MAAAKRSSRKSTGKQAGRPAFTEPRVQLFSKFGGCNFQLSPREFDYVFDDAGHEAEQTDLIPNFMVVQNNAMVTPNQTVQTRQNIVKLFDAPPLKKMTGVATLIKDELYVACNDKTIHYGKLSGDDLNSMVTITDKDPSDKDNTWTFLGYADDQLVGMTAGKQLWTGDLAGHEIENALPVPDPTDTFGPAALQPHGDLVTSGVYSNDTPFRISIFYTLLNKYGPTLASDPYTFFASKPTTEWSGAAYLTLKGTVANSAGITGVEIYYAEGEYQEPAFLARVKVPDDGPDWVTPKPFSYDWKGYLYDSAMWMDSNLTLPNQNYTAGVPASMMAVHDGQLYFWGNDDQPYRIWIGGGPGNRFSVSLGTGGGFVDCEPGVGTDVRSVLKFKTQQGASIVTALCDNENSQREHRFNLVENNISLSNEQAAKGWLAEKIAGTVGCKSPRGAIVAGDGLYAVSRYGLALTTLTMEYNSQLQVQYASDAIEPVFLKQYGNQLSSSVLFYVNGTIYMTFGSKDGDLDNVIFCYDVSRKAWWTYTLDIDEPILNMIHIDHEDSREGIGIITESSVYLLPTTRDESTDVLPAHEVLIESAELSTTQPLQAMHHLSQLEFRFDYFIGEMDIIVQMIDQFGRQIDTRKHISHGTVQHQLAEYIRIDQVVESYKVVLKGKANMRLTHFLAKLYPKPARIGMVWGFDSQQSHTSPGSIHRTFNDYNDLKKAIIP